MKNITIITSTRAEYGLLRPIIQKVAAAQDLQLQLVVTGAHLCARFGNTVQEIEADGLRAARHATGRLIFRHPHCAYRQSSVPPHKHYINR